MAKADTSVKWFHSGMADAPTLSGTAGAMLGVLDACLINGFSTRTPDSIVVSAGVATVSISAGNPYEKHAVIVISGASDAALNAEWRIATAGASSFTFLCPGVADGIVSGATVKRAGAGWEKPFSGTNKGVYQSPDPESTQLYLRVDDTAATNALVRGYETMTGVDTGEGEFPLFSVVPSMGWIWAKSATADATAQPWVVIADARFFYLIPFSRGFSATTYAPSTHFFGDFESFLPNDTYRCAIVAHWFAPTTASRYHPNLQGSYSAGQYGTFAARTEDGLGISPATSVYHGGPYQSIANAGPAGLAGPLPDGTIPLGSPSLLGHTSSGGTARGKLPSLRSVMLSVTPTVFCEMVESTDGAFLSVACSTNVTSSTTHQVPYCAFFEVTKKWR